MSIQKLVLTTVLSILLSGFTVKIYTESRSASSAHTNFKLGNIDKQKLTKAIKADLYRMFIHEMGIISCDWKEMSQGNEILEEDLKNLYLAFNSSEEEAQQKLDEFCKIWKLNAIKIR